jgi:hypothetical protein
MNDELDKQLCAKYPLLFKDRNADMRTTAMVWGFCHGDGWFNIIDILCWHLHHKYDDAVLRHANLVTRLGKPLFGDKVTEHTKLVTQEDIDAAKAKIDAEAALVPTVVQVKEKFGTLRFYVNSATGEQYNYISFAESMSGVTCETCGSPGKRLGRGWVYTACEEHTKDDDWAESLVTDEEE